MITHGHIDLELSCEQKESQNLAKNPEYKPWTMTQAFYAGMRGVVIDTRPSDGKEYIPGSPLLTITARGAHFLVMNGVIPHVTKAEIKDKSKANAFAKIFTVVQGSWLIIQCIARLCYKLPITLLEINTVGHILCACAIYFFWFSKPLDVDAPTFMNDSSLPSLCALMWMNSSVSEKSTSRWTDRSGRELQCLLASTYHIKKTPKRQKSEHMNGLSMNEETVAAGKMSISTKKSGSNKDGVVSLKEGDVLPDTIFSLMPLEKKSSRRTARGIKLGVTDIQRWEMASQVIKSKKSLLDKKNFNKIDEPIPNSFQGWKFKEMVCDRSKDWPRRDLDHDSSFWFLPLATAIYGGLHIGAWNGYFPTSIEQRYWRCSSIAAAASGCVVALFGATLALIDVIEHRVEGYRSTFISIFDWGVYLFGFVGIVGISVVSRLFLVIEAFISLRKLPVAAYDTPRWLQDIPHI